MPAKPSTRLLRTSLGRAAVAVLLASVGGCSMCQGPYDYCTAVTGPNGCPCWCDFGARMNSVFAPPAGYAHGVPGPTQAADDGSRPAAYLSSATGRDIREAPPEPPRSEELADERQADELPAATAEADGRTYLR